MARIPFAVALLMGLVACSRDEGDPERKKILLRLADPRPVSRIDAVKRLAPKADRGEATAIAKAAKDAPSEVRVEVAAALGVAPVREAVDLLGAMLRDPADEVRAAAVDALAKKLTDPKAHPYIVRAYATGGPLTRVAVTGAGLLADAVKAETGERRARLDERLADPRSQVRGESIEELGASADDAAIPELVRLAREEAPPLAAAAIRGLVAAEADALPVFVEALASGRPFVAEAAARALGEVGSVEASAALASAIGKADRALTNVILEAFGGLPLADADREKVCAKALSETDNELALVLAAHAGQGCLPKSIDRDPRRAATQLLVLAAAGRADAKALERARSLVKDPQLALAAAAATYLGVAGAPADARGLALRARNELEANANARVRRAAELEAKKAEGREEEVEEYETAQTAMALAGDGRRLPKPLQDKLSRLIMSKVPTSALLPWESRPGLVAFVAAAAAAGVKLGARDALLVDGIAADADPRLRRAAVDVATMLGADGEPVLEALAKDPVPEVALAAALARPQLDEALAATLLEKATPDGRIELARRFGREPSKWTSQLVELARGGDIAAPVAMQELSRTGDAQALAIARERLDDARQVGAYSAIRALAARDDASAPVDELLARGAVHPNGAVRATALRALARRKACEAAKLFAPLAGEFERRVRTAAGALVAACP